MTTTAVQALPQDLRVDHWAERVRSELVSNILPFWPRHVMDRENGGFYGIVDSDLRVRKDSVRASVINTRILWTYSAAARLVDPAWREVADWAASYLNAKFWDAEYGGLYWMLDHHGFPVSDRKQTYSQAFGIYAFAEHFRMTGEHASLQRAKTLFELVEQHCSDPGFGGYLEARGRRWQALDDVRLSDKDLNSPKSMNTHLHVLEGYTNLLRAWPDARLKNAHRALLKTMLERIVDPATWHLKLFFDERWNSLCDHVSFGHDIEGSWLLVEAAEVLGDAALIDEARRTAVNMAEAAITGLDRDGSMLFEADGAGRIVDDRKHWWVQAESVVGFYNAWQISGDERFRTIARRAWDYIESSVVDRLHGEWHAKLSREGRPLTEAEEPEAYLVGPWKCPYHNARVCYEMLKRLGDTGERAP